MARVIAYVDGFNLYFGLKTAGFKRLYWLDVAALAGNLLKPGQTLAATHYFTARIRDNGRNTADRKRQGDYLEALGMNGTAIQLGHYLEKQRGCRKCHAEWTDYEEKMTDVNIAIQLLSDAFDDNFDVALVMSGDSDLTTPIRRVRERFPRKRVVVAFPPKRHSAELKRWRTVIWSLARTNFAPASCRIKSPSRTVSSLPVPLPGPEIHASHQNPQETDRSRATAR